MVRNFLEIPKTPGGRAFLWFWSGQFFSFFGSEITSFALGVWLFQKTGQAAPLYLTGLANYLPRLLFSVPIGVLADRLNRQRLMVLADLSQAAITVLMLVLLLENALEPWLIYILIAIKSMAGVVQEATEGPITTSLVPSEHLERAFSMDSITIGTSRLFGPILGAFLVGSVGLQNILLFDALTFVAAGTVTGLLRVAQPPRQDAERRSLLEDAKAGFQFIFANPGLKGLMLTFVGFNMTLPLTSRLVTPLVLSRTQDDTATLGWIAAALGLGTLVGGLVVGSLITPRRKVHFVLLGIALAGVFEQVLMGVGQVPWVWIFANLIGGLISPFYETAYITAFLKKAPTEILSRVLTAQSLINRIMISLMYGAGGIYADRLFEPAMRGPLGTTLEPLLGTGPGRGYSLMMIVAGVLTVVIGLSGYYRPGVLTLEQDIPDAKRDDDPPPEELDPYQTLVFTWDFESPDAGAFDDTGPLDDFSDWPMPPKKD